MERNTVTIFGELKMGDRFYLMNDKNKVMYDILCKSATPVVFLRHSHAN